MNQPVVAITTKRVTNTNVISISLNEFYVKSINKAGGIPLLVPVGTRKEQIGALSSRVDAFLLSGGGDIDPNEYKGKAHSKVDGVDPDRDDMEFEIINIARKHSIPLLGICRGCQVMNVALGGTLFTDIADQYQTDIQHSNTDFNKIIHTNTIQKGTKLSTIISSSTIHVNSLHHQGIEHTGSGLIVNALASDGFIEGIELAENGYFQGVQWHPEALPEETAAQELFKSFIRAANEFRKENGNR